MYNFSTNFQDFAQRLRSNNNHLAQIITLILAPDATIKDLKDFLVDHPGILEQSKQDALDYLICYCYAALKDDCISESELNDFLALKRVFAIKDGDFFKYKQAEVVEVLKQQFFRMYSDDLIDKSEAITQVNLQIMFGLSFDEFQKLKQDQVIASLLNGADPKELDINALPKGFDKNQ